MAASSNNITLDLYSQQIGEIKVHSQIINDLSSGIYSSPASCIKELVNNSFDADARSVIIRMKPIEDTITLWDDGNGMNAKDFDENFAWISKSNKRNKGQLSATGRPLIGKIGIGFIAVNEICKVLEITSSKSGEPFKFVAQIDFDKIINAQPAVSEDDETYLKGMFTLVNEDEEVDEHYTSIRLVGLKETVLKIFNDETYKAGVAKSKNRNFAHHSFASMKELLAYHQSKSVYSWENDTEYIQFIIDLASYIPVEYIEEGPIEGVDDSIIKDIIREHKEFDFKVDFDGIYLKKPIFFPIDKSKRETFISFREHIKVKEETDDEGENTSEEEKNITFIDFHGYFYIQNHLLIPRELNGIAIRIKNIPIAERFGFDSTFLRYPNYMDQIFRNWVSGEIYVTKGLESAMNIDRKSFRVTHPDYLVLQNFLHEFLKEKVFKAAFALYEQGKEYREDIKDKINDDIHKKILETKQIHFEVKPKEAKKNKTVGNNKFVPLAIYKNKADTVIEVDSTVKSRYKKSDWKNLETVFIIFENAFQDSDGNIETLRELFYKQIEEWKAKK